MHSFDVDTNIVEIRKIPIEIMPVRRLLTKGVQIQPEAFLGNLGEYGPLKHIMHYSNEVFELKLLFNLCVLCI